MPVKMKALRTFRGRDGEGNERNRVKAGTEFQVADDGRASSLVRAGMATIVVGAGKAKAAAVAEPKKNEAATAGPTKGQAGGKTGAAEQQSSSEPAPAQRKPRAKKGENAAASSKKSEGAAPKS